MKDDKPVMNTLTAELQRKLALSTSQLAAEQGMTEEEYLAAARTTMSSATITLSPISPEENPSQE